ncbi:MAG TPA: hypothetical protein VL857_13575 [Candidatus Eisenbacteria bacterium]|nr:hypothetical protein [Candidatus Eisenbacteria bacterium]
MTRRHERNSRARQERKAIYLRVLRILSLNRAAVDEYIQEGPAPGRIVVREPDMRTLTQELPAL